MKVFINGLPVESESSNLQELLEEQGYAKLVVATAVNGEFVAKQNREMTTLASHCHVEIVAPMQGG